MQSITTLIIFMAIAVPSSALSPIEQAYKNGVEEGLRLGQLVNNIEKYNFAVQQFNDNLNQTFGDNASMMWLPKMAIRNNNTAAGVRQCDHKYTS